MPNQIAFCVLIVVAAVIHSSSQFGCQIPPLYWCDTPEIMKLCGTGETCRRFESAIQNQPVKISLLYETMCRGCRNYIKEILYPTWQNLKSILDVDLVPFGNSNVTIENGKWAMFCQHGPKECAVNMMEACAINKLRQIKPDLYFQFVVCLGKESGDLGNDADLSATNCFRELDLPEEIQKLIMDCKNGWEGAQLMTEMANKTAHAWPQRVNGVPWLMINNVGTDKSQIFAENLGGVICNYAYQGAHRPEECKLYENGKRCCFHNHCHCGSA